MNIKLAHEPLNGVVFINGVEYMPVPEPIKKDYEILSFVNIEKGTVWSIKDSLYCNPQRAHSFNLEEMLSLVFHEKVVIHSIRRFIDGEVFTVGKPKTKFRLLIKRFEIRDNKLKVISEHDFSDY